MNGRGPRKLPPTYAVHEPSAVSTIRRWGGFRRHQSFLFSNVLGPLTFVDIFTSQIIGENLPSPSLLPLSEPIFDGWQAIDPCF